MLDKIDLHRLQTTLPEIHIGLTKYVNIMNALYSCDVSEDTDFQRKFKGFYRVRRNDDFCRIYFRYMEQNKALGITFEDFESVITCIYNSTNRIEPSFSSKLLATINPYMPVWDSLVLSQLSLKAPAYYKKDRLHEDICLYEALCSWYVNYLETQNSKEVLHMFDEFYPNTNLTSVKKIDLILWSIGKDQ